MLHCSEEFLWCAKCKFAKTCHQTFCSVSCLTFEKRIRNPYKDKSYLLRALVLHLHGHDNFNETPNLFDAYLQNMEVVVNSTDVQSLCMNDILTVKDLTNTSNVLYNFDSVVGNLDGELA